MVSSASSSGVKAARLELLYEIYPTPGYTNERIYIYQAFDGKYTQTHLDEGEFLDVEWIPLEQVKERFGDKLSMNLLNGDYLVTSFS